VKKLVEAYHQVQKRAEFPSRGEKGKPTFQTQTMVVGVRGVGERSQNRKTLGGQKSSGHPPAITSLFLPQGRGRDSRMEKLWTKSGYERGILCGWGTPQKVPRDFKRRKTAQAQHQKEG